MKLWLSFPIYSCGMACFKCFEAWSINNHLWLKSDEIHISLPFSKTRQVWLKSKERCSTIWKDSLQCDMTPIVCYSRWFWCVKVALTHQTSYIFFFCIYMPFDTNYDQANADLIVDALNYISWLHQFIRLTTSFLQVILIQIYLIKTYSMHSPCAALSWMRILIFLLICVQGWFHIWELYWPRKINSRSLYCF